MANVILLEQQVEIPQDLRSLADFRRCHPRPPLCSSVRLFVFTPRNAQSREEALQHSADFGYDTERPFIYCLRAVSGTRGIP